MITLTTGLHGYVLQRNYKRGSLYICFAQFYTYKKERKIDFFFGFVKIRLHIVRCDTEEKINKI